MKSNDLSKFDFRSAGVGHYDVTYTTGRGDYHCALVENGEIINSTKNAEVAKIKYIKALRDLVKRTGRHFHSNGKPFLKVKKVLKLKKSCSKIW